jgi:hypothetical protein
MTLVTTNSTGALKRYREGSTMKRIIQGLAFAALILGAPAVWSEWNLNDADAGASIPVQSTYADRHAGESVQLHGFASIVDGDAGVSLPTQSTYADRFARDRARVASSASTQAALSLLDVAAASLMSLLQ